MIDLSPRDLTTLKRILARLVPKCEVRAFGSRIAGNARENSDLDLVVVGPDKVSRRTLSSLRHELEESSVPFTVDVLDWHRISPELRNNIEKQYETIQNIHERTIPEGWTIRKISEIAEVIGGGTPKTDHEEYWGGDIPWITPKDLAMDHPRFVRRGERNITRKGLENSSARLLPPNAVLLTTRAPVGYVALAGKALATNQGLRNLVLRDGYNPQFIYYLLCQNTEYVRQHVSGSTFQEISGSTLKTLAFPIPPLSEQCHIADILGSLDDKIELNRRTNRGNDRESRDIAELRDTLLPKLISGELRVSQADEIVKEIVE